MQIKSVRFYRSMVFSNSSLGSWRFRRVINYHNNNIKRKPSSEFQIDSVTKLGLAMSFILLPIEL